MVPNQLSYEISHIHCLLVKLIFLCCFISDVCSESIPSYVLAKISIFKNALGLVIEPLSVNISYKVRLS